MLPGAPNRYSRDRGGDDPGCLDASLTAAYSDRPPDPWVPGAFADPWLSAIAVESPDFSWLATVFPFGATTLASQSKKARCPGPRQSESRERDSTP